MKNSHCNKSYRQGYPQNIYYNSACGHIRGTQSRQHRITEKNIEIPKGIILQKGIKQSQKRTDGPYYQDRHTAVAQIGNSKNCQTRSYGTNKQYKPEPEELCRVENSSGKSF